MKQRKEYSRYYGDFRGVDFSSDHTLVNASRFPYLVNMYKDYAAGGGQGIETIPGFRRRFTAENGGRIHGIHSYKLPNASGEGVTRHVLVHAGSKLYKWASYPAEVGEAKCITATVLEYDEYDTDDDEVGVGEDYVYVSADVNRVSEEYLGIVDVRAIKKVGGKWISIYPESLYYGEPLSSLYIKGAYTADIIENGERALVRVKIPKRVTREDGSFVASFAPGDAVEVCFVVYDIYDIGVDEGEFESITEKQPGISDCTIEYSFAVSPWAATNIVAFELFDNHYNSTGRIAAIPARAADPVLQRALAGYVVLAPGSFSIEWDAYNKKDARLKLKAIRSGNNVYLEREDGGIIELNNYVKEGCGINVDILYPDVYSDLPLTAVDLNEHEDLEKVDYNYIDISGSSELDIDNITTVQGDEIPKSAYQKHGDLVLIEKEFAEIGTEVVVTFETRDSPVLADDMNERDSVSFVFGDNIYILDGKRMRVYDGEKLKLATEEAYIPTTYINIMVGGENADAGKEYEARNMLQPKFKHTFVPDGTTKAYYMNEAPLDSVEEVKAYGKKLKVGTLGANDSVTEGDYAVDLGKGKIVFAVAPKKSEDVQIDEADDSLTYPEGYAGVEITASRAVYPSPADDGEVTSKEFTSIIESSTVVTVFDDRVFYAGVKKYSNFVFWSALKNPTYIGLLNYAQDGAGSTPITALVPVADSLLALKADTEQGGAAYYHTPAETGVNVAPKTYPSVPGLAGIGCLGAACSFLDDPVYISRLGLEAIGQLSIRYERAREHRSSLVDGKLVNQKGLANAKLCEWSGYLILLVDGNIYMADSRQRYTDDTGAMQYEWYYIEDVGVYEDQRQKFEYMTEYPGVLIDPETGVRQELTVSYEGRDYVVGIIGDTEAEYATEVGWFTDVVYGETVINGSTMGFWAAMYPTENGFHACLCKTEGEMIDGRFVPAVCIISINEDKCENIYFGTENGVVCSFNFDMRESDGMIPPKFYTFDGRLIRSGCALKMDNCSIPHLTKTTVKRSTVIKVKSMQRTAAKVRVRTNKNPFSQVARINGNFFAFDDIAFSDFSFVISEDTLFAVREKEKKWVEKQYYLYSDEYMKPFALYYLAYKYYIAGKYKD